MRLRISLLSRSIWEPVTKSLFALSSSGADAAFRVRYITICISGIVGPSICTYLTKFSESSYQIIATIVVYALVSIFAFWIVPSMKTNEMNHSLAETTRERFGLCNITGVLSLDFISIIIGGTLVYMAFSQFESIFPLFLNEYFDNAVQIFSTLLILNCVFSAMFQMFYSYGQSSLYLSVTAICIYSIGEVLVIPATDVVVDEISPENQKSLFYGIVEIRSIGFTAGPILTSAVLQEASPTSMCIMTIAHVHTHASVLREPPAARSDAPLVDSLTVQSGNLSVPGHFDDLLG